VEFRQPEYFLGIDFKQRSSYSKLPSEVEVDIEMVSNLNKFFLIKR
jgi:hypothetical protein